MNYSLKVLLKSNLQKINISAKSNLFQVAQIRHMYFIIHYKST